ncbi:NAD(P)/FAD-dependent oxidoreductase [Haliangium ochraceum]|uniref:FAD-dependent pyridine nucleotide-disulphide oxidoreductase n=1 Tax=Haliangium ochraceum (strain DSM 14365 / JCM 11303 / SMP-2) TaxID=502025 RepID=D0LLH9_HALO1|nr:NAD(P)/FAD-dependent oxidoreductase [Haliangium ochraceum]ACY13196.1 FAD-dependent pyridine nucleotide-disulphide oxidoreductase [Haliangium ochraceum DSM 14365]
MSEYDVIIVGGGPAGLAAALTLGRACRRVLLCDAGSPRNAAATHIHNFVTRDGTPPAEFRLIGREQLAPYASVEIQNLRVTSIAGERGGFRVTSSAGSARARRIILCTGMVDEMLDIPGFRDGWGHSIFQCPYCHGWEVRGRRWGYLALDTFGLEHGFPALLKNWSDDVVVFTAMDTDVPAELLDGLRQRGIRFEASRVARLAVDDRSLTHVELEDGTRVPCEVLYAHPPQRHVEFVQRLGLTLDELGYVQVDPLTRQTSRPGVYAAGDLTTRAQSAIFAAAAGAQAAGMLNHELSMEVTH